MNILFLCTSNVNRSKTAEDYFKSTNESNHYRSAGLSEKYCAKNNSKLCSIEDVEWADKIYVMEQLHIDRIKRYAGEKYLKKVINIEIEDIYTYMDEELIEILKAKVENS